MSDFPLLVFLSPNPTRHELILLPADASLATLTSTIEMAVRGSPNCEELMSKYSKGLDSQQVAGMTARWTGRDGKAWPPSTKVTEENWPAVRQVLQAYIGRDSLEVTFEDIKEVEAT